MSGDVREDVGVRLWLALGFRGIKLGEDCANRGNSGSLGGNTGSSSWGVGGCLGMFVGIGGGWTDDNRFSRRASVGLIVLAPNPLIRPEATDCRLLLVDEVGVVARCTEIFAGDRAVMPLGSPSLPGIATLLTLAWRDCVVAVSVDTRGSSAPADAEGCTKVRLAAPKLPLRATDGLEDSGGTGGPDCGTGFRSMILLNKPGPIDFLGCFVGFEGSGCPKVEALCGTVDCRLVRRGTVVCVEAAGSLMLLWPTGTLGATPAPNVCL